MEWREEISARRLLGGGLRQVRRRFRAQFGARRKRRDVDFYPECFFQQRRAAQAATKVFFQG